MHPDLAGRTLRIVAHVKIIRPAVSRNVGAVRPQIAHFAAIVEFAFLTWPAERTRKELHGLPPNARSLSRRLRRSGDREQSGRDRRAGCCRGVCQSPEDEPAGFPRPEWP